MNVRQWQSCLQPKACVCSNWSTSTSCKYETTKKPGSSLCGTSSRVKVDVEKKNVSFTVIGEKTNVSNTVIGDKKNVSNTVISDKTNVSNTVIGDKKNISNTVIGDKTNVSNTVIGDKTNVSNTVIVDKTSVSNIVTLVLSPNKCNNILLHLFGNKCNKILLHLLSRTSTTEAADITGSAKRIAGDGIVLNYKLHSSKMKQSVIEKE